MFYRPKGRGLSLCVLEGKGLRNNYRSGYHMWQQPGQEERETKGILWKTVHRSQRYSLKGFPILYYKSLLVIYRTLLFLPNTIALSLGNREIVAMVWKELWDSWWGLALEQWCLEEVLSKSLNSFTQHWDPHQEPWGMSENSPGFLQAGRLGAQLVVCTMKEGALKYWRN